ncbi:MAG: glycosyltransferase [Clostridia bacterium]|nr:glycosyltransferase [Clostridia bacterium]
MQHDSLSRISVIVPSLNPDEKLGKTISSLLEIGFTDIICVNDGSREDCLCFFPEESENITRLTHKINLGKGAALKTAFSYILENRPDSLGAVTVDGDGQHAAKDVLNCVQKMVDEKDKIILGCRDFSLSNVPQRSRFGNRVTSGVFRVLCGLKISDTQTGLRAFPAKWYKDMLEVSGERFEYETNMLLEMKARKIPYGEVKIETVYIEENKTSHFRPFRDSYRIYSLIFKFTLGRFFKFILSSVVSFVLDALLVYMFLELCEKLFFVNFADKTSLSALLTFCSKLLARAISSFVNFTINRKIVFSAENPYKASLFKYYCLAVPIALVSSVATAVLELVPIFGTTALIVLLGLAVDCVLFIASYSFQKKWVFISK